MDLDPVWFLSMLLASGAGFVALVYGRKQSRLPHMLAGVVLLVFPYFTSSWPLVLGTTVVVLAALWLVVRWGY
ncbi:MAG: hypothetical protein MUF54_09285 [Polyangiaceae bacterium]|nr:hypothetical protein [Polyangiaceae bacterium]